MRVLTLSAVAFLLVVATPAAAQSCVGSDTLRTCIDQYGNSYTTTRMGNSSTTYGSNTRTGSNWSQQSYRMGNTTTTYGSDARGRTWNSTTTPYGTYGTDSQGNSFYSPNYGTSRNQRQSTRPLYESLDDPD